MLPESNAEKTADMVPCSLSKYPTEYAPLVGMGINLCDAWVSINKVFWERNMDQNHPSSIIHHPSLIVIINSQSSATMSSILKHANSSLLFAAIFSLQALKNAYPVTGPPLSLPTGPTGFYLRKHDAAGSEEPAIFGEDCSLRQV